MRRVASISTACATLSSAWHDQTSPDRPAISLAIVIAASSGWSADDATIRPCLPAAGAKPICSPMVPRSPLDDPRNAGFAWARYRRLMKLMSGVTLVVVIAALALLHHQGALISVHFYIATGLGIAAAMMLMAALMGLVFLSSGTGHDESVADATEAQPGDGPSNGRKR